MDQNFNCFVEIDDQKYDVIINEDFSSICFEDIYQKLQKIIKLALNRDIDIRTHDFEVFDHNSSKGLIIQSFGHFIRHLSTIRIHSKQVISPSVLFNPFDPNSYQLPQQTPQTVTVQPIIRNASQKPEEDIVPHDYYCDRCPELVAKQSCDPLLKKIKLNLNFESYKRFSDLLQTVKVMSNYKCDSITEYEWLNVLPFKMRAFGYKNCSPKLWKNSFDLFLKKYIEVMDGSPNRSIACSLFPFFHEFNSYEFDPRRDPNVYKMITNLRQKMNRTERTESSSKSSSYRRSSSSKSKSKKSKSSKDENSLRKLKSKLLTEEEDIHAFYRMVKLIEPGVNYTKKPIRKWTKLSYKMVDEFGYSSRKYSPNNCKDRFYNWALFYAKNFDEINGNIDSKLQQIFDLLKIVHILDLTLLFGGANDTRYRLKRIEKKSEIKDYLRQLDYEEYQNRRSHRSRSPSKTKTLEKENHLKTVQTDLEEGEIPEEVNSGLNCTVVRTEAQPSVTSKVATPSFQPKVPLSDPRLERQKTSNLDVVTDIRPVPTNGLRIPLERDSCLEAIPMNIEKAMPVIIIDQTIQSIVPQRVAAQRDPRLRGKSSVTPLSENSSAISADKPIPSHIVGINNPIDLQKQPPVLTSVATVNTICEPILQSHDITNRNEAVENSPLPLNSNKHATTQQMNGLFPKMQSNVLRDPRLKRKRDNHSEEVVTQSVNKTPNSVKKLKSEPIEILEIL